MNSDFEKFRQIVLAEEPLQVELRDLSDRKEFIARAVELGAMRGFHFTENAVDEAIRVGRRAWIEQGLQGL